jgi:DNA adenine methylase
MPITETPLRYPGGKSRLFNFVDRLLSDNDMFNCTYVEPFAGGAGLALSLLFKGKVKEIVINDLDYCIFSFWYCVLNRTTELVGAINEISVTINEWLKQREIQNNPQGYDIFQVALSTFFLNRVNRSGIIKGGVIGGLEQKGKYKLDCRFNKVDLISKIERISQSKSRIKLYNMDVKDFIPKVINKLGKNTFIYFDPPYIVQGSNLYYNFFREEDHLSLSKQIIGVELPWILTYDNEDIIYSMYKGHTISELELSYSAGTRRKGKELIVYSKRVYADNRSKIII